MKIGKSWTMILPSWDGSQFPMAVRHSCRYQIRSIRYSVIHGLDRSKAPSNANDDLRLSLLFFISPWSWPLRCISDWKTLLGRRICFFNDVSNKLVKIVYG